MCHKKSITIIPEFLFASDVISWLNLKEVSSFDTSMTSTLTRYWLLCCLEKFRIEPTCLYKMNIPIIRWLTTRKIPIRFIYGHRGLGDDFMTDELILGLIQHCGKQPFGECAPTSRRLMEVASIDLSNCSKVTDMSIIKLLESSPQLSTVILNNCSTKLTSHSVVAIGYYCSELEKLELSNFPNLSVEAVEVVVKTCRFLRNLDLSSTRRGKFGMTSRTDNIDSIMSLVAINCRRLESLNLRGRFVSDSSILALANATPPLRQVDVGGCRSLSADALIRLAQACPHLRHVNLSCCWQVTDGCVLAFAESCVNLSYLSLTLCPQISDVGINHLSNHAQHLKSLNISRRPLNQAPHFIPVGAGEAGPPVPYNGVVSGPAILRLIERCVNLRCLDYSGCTLVYAHRMALMALRPSLELDFEDI